MGYIYLSTLLFPLSLSSLFPLWTTDYYSTQEVVVKIDSVTENRDCTWIRPVIAGSWQVDTLSWRLSNGHYFRGGTAEGTAPVCINTDVFWYLRGRGRILENKLPTQQMAFNWHPLRVFSDGDGWQPLSFYFYFYFTMDSEYDGNINITPVLNWSTCEKHLGFVCTALVWGQLIYVSHWLVTVTVAKSSTGRHSLHKDTSQCGIQEWSHSHPSQPWNDEDCSVKCHHRHTQYWWSTVGYSELFLCVLNLPATVLDYLFWIPLTDKGNNLSQSSFQIQWAWPGWSQSIYSRVVDKDMEQREIYRYSKMC